MCPVRAAGLAALTVPRTGPAVSTSVIRIEGDRDIARRIAPAARALRAGKLVAFPTETVYGLGVVATNRDAVERLRQVKDRPESPFTVHIPHPDQVYRFVKDVPPRARTLIQKAWPGPLTLLLPVDPHLADPEYRDRELYQALCPGGVIGVRCPDEPVCRLLLERASLRGKGRGPVIASSANLAGRRPPISGDDVLEQLADRIDLLVDAGPTRYRNASTIVAVEGPNLRVVREGVYDAAAIERMARRLIVFVCTGNTCRSPMAAGIARHLLAERLGVGSGELGGLGLEVQSAGLFAGDGARATPEARQAAAELGVDLGPHRSRKLTDELIQAADVIFCMTTGHAEEVRRRVPSAGGWALALDPEGDIADPIGSGVDTYVKVARRMAWALRRRMKENML